MNIIDCFSVFFLNLKAIYMEFFSKLVMTRIINGSRDGQFSIFITTHITFKDVQFRGVIVL